MVITGLEEIAAPTLAQDGKGDKKGKFKKKLST